MIENMRRREKSEHTPQPDNMNKKTMKTKKDILICFNNILNVIFHLI